MASPGHTAEGAADSIPACLTIYRYGALAWIWRFLIVLFLAAGIGALALAYRAGELWPLWVALPLVAPALFFGTVLAVRIDRVGPRGLRVLTLLFWWRRFEIDELGIPKARIEYHDGELGVVHAPRMWVSVRRRLPIYVDLLGEIPSRSAFALTFAARNSAMTENE